MLTVRECSRTDVVPLGELTLDALLEAPSSTQELDEVPNSPLYLGEEIAEGREEALRPLVAELSGELAGFAAFERRSMARSHHVVEVLLLVHPQARGQGVGRRLLEATERRFKADPGVGKLVMIVAADDQPLRALVSQAPHWSREQCCPRAWARGSERVDVESWANLAVANLEADRREAGAIDE
ncbi:MAG: hypothetical protein CL940_03125 [Deltaproteobacteria bacterium]|nr:hypothetical protein [Deltaproteobacteria bacterium]